MDGQPLCALSPKIPDLIKGHEKYSDEGQEHARQIVFG
jgi:hypothetical protein